MRKNALLITHVWQKLGGWCILTTTTKYKSGNGLTPSAANRPAFPSAKRYAQAVKKKNNNATNIFLLLDKFKIEKYADT